MFLLIENNNYSLAPEYATMIEAMTAASDIAEFNLSWKQDRDFIRAEHGSYTFLIKQAPLRAIYTIFQDGKYLSAHQNIESANKSVAELDKHFCGVINFTIQEVELINN